MNKNRRAPMGMGRGRGNNEKAKDLGGTLKKLLAYLKPYHLKICFVMVFAICSTIFNILGPKILAKATDKLSEGIMAKVANTGGIDFNYIVKILLILVVLYAASSLFSYIMGWIISGVSQDAAFSLRKDISEKMNRLPLSYFDKHTSGDILSRVTNDIDTIAQSLNQSLSTLISNVVTLVGIFIMMLTISWQMTLIAVVVLPVSMILMRLVMKHSQKYFTQQQNSLGDVNGHIEEMYGGHQVVKAFNGEEKSVEQFEQYNESLYTSAWKSQFFGSLMMPISNFIGNIGYVGVCIIGGILAGSKTITIGDIQAFIQYVRQFNQPISQIAQAANLLQSTGAAAERVFEFLEEEELTEDSATLSTEEVQNMKGAVTFADVHFGYNPDKIIINDFSLHVHAGQKVAIVGPTGAGKTTIIKLLMRFYELNGGSIMIDGEDITQMKRSDLRSLFGMVLQDTWLFKGTIRDNIAYGSNNATDEEIIEAAKKAHAHKFIIQLKGGYDAMLAEEGSNLSQGQRQLLSIARIMLANPPMLILDEATSSIDTRTERQIQDAFDTMMIGRTTFIVAHRLSTIQKADQIIVMNDGHIIEQGKHEELLKKNGFYHNLYYSQFEKPE